MRKLRGVLARRIAMGPRCLALAAPTPSCAILGVSRMRLEDLIDTCDPGWPVVAAMVRQATNTVGVLPARSEDGERTLLAVQVTTRSPMGAIVYQTGGILIDHGWLRILGSGHPRLPRDLARWNFPDGDVSRTRLPRAFLVADDAVGGFFALNGGALPGPAGHVFYLAPDSLRWEDTGRGYTDFLQFACIGDLTRYYGDHRWVGSSRVDLQACKLEYSIVSPK